MSYESEFSFPAPENTRVPFDIDKRREEFYRTPTFLEALRSEKIASRIQDLNESEKKALNKNLEHKNGQAFLANLSIIANKMELLSAFTDNDNLINLPLTAGVTEILIKHFLLLIDDDLSQYLDTWDTKNNQNQLLLDIMNGYFDEYYNYYHGNTLTESNNTEQKIQQFTVNEEDEMPRTVSRIVIFDKNSKTARRIIFIQKYMIKKDDIGIHTTTFSIRDGQVSFEHLVHVKKKTEKK